MLSYSSAIELIKWTVKIPLSTDLVFLEDSVGMVLAEDIYSDINLPPFDNSEMDGYAIKYSDNISKWKVIGEITAGNFHDININKDSTVSIMTGAKIPSGADTVIPIEDIIIDGDFIILNEKINLKRGIHIRKSGEDICCKTLVLNKLEQIELAHIPILASCGKKLVPVLKPLIVAVLSSGDELVDINSVPINDQIRATNIYTLITLIKAIGMIPLNFGLVKDNKVSLKSKLSELINSDADIIITTGGVSVGNSDFIKAMFEELGAKTVFWKVNIKPGKPILFQTIDVNNKQKIIFGLPGNPMSAFVNFNIFIKPLIYHLYNLNHSKDHFNAVLEFDLSKQDGKLHFVMASSSFDIESGINYVNKTGAQRSGYMMTMSKSNCLIIFKEEIGNLSKGDIVECIKI